MLRAHLVAQQQETNRHPLDHSSGDNHTKAGAPDEESRTELHEDRPNAECRLPSERIEKEGGDETAYELTERIDGTNPLVLPTVINQEVSR